MLRIRCTSSLSTVALSGVSVLTICLRVQMASPGSSQNLDHTRPKNGSETSALAESYGGEDAATGGAPEVEQKPRGEIKPVATLAPLAMQPMAPLDRDHVPIRRSHSDSTISTPSPANDLVRAGPRKLPFTAAGPRHETQSLHVTCASSSTSSTVVHSTNAVRSVISASLSHHPSPPQSDATHRSVDLNSSSTCSRLLENQPEAVSQRYGQPPRRSPGKPPEPPPPPAQASNQLREHVMSSLHRSLCHPAVCCTLLILHIISLYAAFQQHSATPATQTLWTALHLVTFCCNLLLIQFDSQATPTVASEGPVHYLLDPCCLAGLACTVPGAARVLVAAVRWPAALLALQSGIQTPGWHIWLEVAAQVAAALLNAACSLTVAAVPLRGAAKRLCHILAQGAGAAVILTVLPPQMQPPLWAVMAIWLLVRALSSPCIPCRAARPCHTQSHCS